MMGYLISLESEDMEFRYFLVYLQEYKYELFSNLHFSRHGGGGVNQIKYEFMKYKERFEKAFANPELLDDFIKQEEKEREEEMDYCSKYVGQIGKESVGELMRERSQIDLKKCFDLYCEYYSLPAKKRLEFKLDILGKELCLFQTSEEYRNMYWDHSNFRHNVFIAYSIIKKNYVSLKNNQFPANMFEFDYNENIGTIHSHQYNGAVLAEKNIEEVLSNYPKFDPRWKTYMYCTLKPSDDLIEILHKYNYTFEYMFESMDDLTQVSSDFLSIPLPKKEDIESYEYLISIQKQLFEIYHTHEKEIRGDGLQCL